MKDDTTPEGCIRCRDYEKIKDELESGKRRSQDEQKNALKRCEDGKAKLQKKLLTVGAVAIIAGTILGKDFVDKVAEYIESFNSVKDAATKMVSQAPPTPTPTPEPVIEEESTTEEESIPESTFAWIPDIPLSGALSPPSYGDMSLVDIVLSSGYEQTPLENFFNFEYDTVSPLSDIDLLTSFASIPPKFEMDFSFYAFGIDSPPAVPRMAVVPEVHSFLTLLALPMMLNRRGRKP